MSEQLEQLREQHKAMLEAAELKQLQAEVALLEHAASVVPEAVAMREAWGEPVNTAEYLTDTPGFGLDARGLISRPEDRRQGDYYPFWRTEPEHQAIRGAARILHATDEIAIAGIDGIVDYAVGSGMGFKVTPKGKADKSLAAAIQAIVDAFLDQNRIRGEGERELVEASRVDGEMALALEHRGGRVVEGRFVDVASIVQPDNPRDIENYIGETSLDWKYGVATEHGRPDVPLGYFVQWFGDANDWEFYPEHEPDRHGRLFHFEKLNVRRFVKRGLSDLFANGDSMKNADRLGSNLTLGLAIQSAIAFVREHAAGTTSRQIRAMQAKEREFTRIEPTQHGQKSINVRSIEPGHVVDTKQGSGYKPGPLAGEGAARAVDVLQAGMRRAGIRWKFPEYMISGDASNNAFASTMMAESPFIRANQPRQDFYARSFERLLWKVVAIIAKRAPKFVHSMTLRELKQAVSIDVDAPQAEVRDRKEELETLEKEHEMGIVAMDTVASEMGRDLEDEKRKRAEEPTPQPTEPTDGR